MDDFILYSSEPDELELMVCAADYFIKDPIKSACSMLLPIILLQNLGLQLQKVYTEFATEVHPSFVDLMSVNLQGQADSSRAVKQLFFNNNWLFDYDHRERS